ncbi:MAG TPA: PAS domain-containing protein [Candidatus Marinimicrobia bacterium]|nr:PAS domain-containing protein [Candidatus Neomarinimicrobiota bacterium]
MTQSHQSQMVQDYSTTIAILESISDGIFILNSDGKVQYGNKAALYLIGKEIHLVIGEKFQTYVKQVNQIRSRHLIWSKDNLESEPLLILIEKSHHRDDMEAIINAPRNEIPALLTTNFIYDREENLSYIIVLLKDITQWKLLEKEIRQQQALSISRERLQSLGDLFEGLVHEISQPLLSFQLRLELLQKSLSGLSNPAIEKHLKELNQLTERMAKVMDNTRAITQLSNGQRTAMVNVAELLKTTLKMLDYSMQKHIIRYELNNSENLPKIRINTLLLQQVFINILKNAEDAFINQELITEPAKISINLKNKNNKWIEIEVSDNAGGIEAHNLDFVFDPFFTTRSTSEHTGIGLTIVKDIITSMGGDVSISSEYGTGTTLSLRIPVAQQEERAQLFNLIELLHQQ